MHSISRILRAAKALLVLIALTFGLLASTPQPASAAPVAVVAPASIPSKSQADAPCGVDLEKWDDAVQVVFPKNPTNLFDVLVFTRVLKAGRVQACVVEVARVFPKKGHTLKIVFDKPGKNVSASSKGSYVVAKATWKAGQKVTVKVSYKYYNPAYKKMRVVTRSFRINSGGPAV